MTSFILHGGRFLDPRKSELMDGVELLIEGERVKEVSDKPIKSTTATRIDIGGRTVSCQPAPGSENVNCSVDGRDLSEVVLYNGGGRASPEASPELVAAEDHARSERLGVWKR